ncbi:MAG: S26 family signal peptidase [Thermoplasmatota archaeon]
MARTQETPSREIRRAPPRPIPRSARARSHPSQIPLRGREEKEAPLEEEENETFKKKAMREGRSFLFDFLAAVIVLLLIVGALYTFTGNWPPLVVVQSGSMEHSAEESQIGVIDTGDLVFVKKLGDTSIVPYVEGRQKDHRTYSSYGDVIIFRPNGDEDRTAIIHRAVVWIEFNNSTYDYETFEGGGFDIPSMGINNSKGVITIDEYEWPKDPGGDLEIDLGKILRSFRNIREVPHSGFLTKGDDNGGVDQTSDFGPEPWMQPVKKEWILGKSVGELPWFGIIKLWMEGKSDWRPNSQRNLIITLIVIVLLPFVIDFSVHLITRGRKKEGEEEEPPEEEERPKRAGGKKNFIDLEREKTPTRKKAEAGPKRAPSPRLGRSRK